MWSPLDIGIIAVYLVFLMLLGFVLKTRASQGIESYFLGGRNLPWWVIGASGMASNLDVTGTMVAISWIFLLGLNGYWNLMSGHTVIMLAVFMVLTGKWMRRTGAMTSAEWMELRFGAGRAGQMARQLTVATNLLGVIGGIMYFIVGTGKFMADYVPLETVWNLPSESAINLEYQRELDAMATFGREVLGTEATTQEALAAAAAEGRPMPLEPEVPFLTEEFVCAVLIVAFALIYTILSGYYGVVFTDLFQSVLIGFIVLYLGLKAFLMVGEDPAAFRALAEIPSHWENIVPPWRWDTAEYGQLYRGFELMLPICLFFTAKSVLAGFAGAQGYMAQRWLSCRNDREAGLMALLWAHLLSFRWFFIMGMAAMAYLLMAKDPVLAEQLRADPERVLPAILANREIIGAGIFGLVMASLLATGMSTFDSAVNSGASFVVRDVYQRYFRPLASERELVWTSYAASVLLVGTGIVLARSATNINDIWTWLMVGLGGGTFIPLLLMWYWPRMNGQGFATGLAGGMVAAILQRLIAPGIGPMAIFALSATPSLLCTIFGSLLTRPTDEAHLIEFYRKVRPFGLWGRIREHFTPESIARSKAENRRDLWAVAVAVPWQAILFFLPMLFIIHAWTKFWAFLAVQVVLYVLLYYTWIRRLGHESGELEPRAKSPAEPQE